MSPKSPLGQDNKMPGKSRISLEVESTSEEELDKKLGYILG
jgi:hypothetical protein